jgi:hypothetical protein
VIIDVIIIVNLLIFSEHVNSRHRDGKLEYLIILNVEVVAFIDIFFDIVSSITFSGFKFEQPCFCKRIQ